MKDDGNTFLDADHPEEGEKYRSPNDATLFRRKRYPVLEAEENRQLAARAAAGDEQALAKLVNHNMGLVYEVVICYWGSGIPFGDLVQEGCIGLMTAARRFRLEHGTTFGTYAMYWIRQAIGRAVMWQNSLIRLPVHLQERIIDILAAQEELLLAGLSPDDKAVAAKLGLAPEQVVTGLAALRQRHGLISLQDTIRGQGGTDGALVAEWVADTSIPRPETLVEAKQEFGELTSRLVAVLSFVKRHTRRERNYQIFCLRFGFAPEGESLTLEETGRRLGITRERVRQIETNLLQLLVRCPGWPGLTRKELESKIQDALSLAELVSLAEPVGFNFSPDRLPEILAEEEGKQEKRVLETALARVRMIRATVRAAATDQEFVLFCARYGLGKSRAKQTLVGIAASLGLRCSQVAYRVGRLWQRVAMYEKHVSEQRLLLTLDLIERFETKMGRAIEL